MNNETLNRLNAFIADYKKESEEKNAIIKQQNQTLLRISAELEAIKQCDPFDSVLIAGSIENISNMIKGETDPIFDEGCVGCAGPCNVVDVAAKLQKELDKCHETIKTFKILETRETDRLHKNIENLKDSNIDDLKELYDFYEAELRGLKADRTSIKSDRDIMFRNYRNTVDKLQDDIRGLEVELSEKQEIIDNITSLRVDEVEALYCLEAELSARKEDSRVLMEVVEIVKNWDDSTGRAFPTLYKILDELVDYTDAPEEPPEPTIDDLYKVTVSCTFLELP